MGGGVFLVLKNAFDTVDHRIHLKKLHLDGLDKDAISWFDSYLSNRAQRTKVNGCLSDLAESNVTQSQEYGTAYTVLD